MRTSDLTHTSGGREANQQFSALLAAAERDGETIIITRRGKAIARPRGAKIKRDDLYDRDSVKQERAIDILAAAPSANAFVTFQVLGEVYAVLMRKPALPLQDARAEV